SPSTGGRCARGWARLAPRRIPLAGPPARRPMSAALIADPRGVPATRHTAFDRWALRRLRDERDLIFARVTLGVSLTAVPSALLIFAVPTWLVPFLILPHLGIVFGLWGGRYMLMLHAMCHRSAFKRESRWLNPYAMNFLGLFF